jgi:DNA polymerase III subunit beta
MQFTISKADLLKEMNLLQGVVEKKNTIPILSNVLIETSTSSLLSLVATDLDVSLQTEASADVTKFGAVVVQAKKLFDIVRNLPDADIHFIKEDNDWVKINCGTSDFKIVGQAKEHFPSTPQMESYSVQMPAAALHNLISRTIFSITQEESRYALNGALFAYSDAELQMVATDGHRLALAAQVNRSEADHSDSPEQGAKTSVIIPKKALNELLKLTAGSEEMVGFANDENHLYFQLGPRKLTTRKLSGQFPNYELVVPKTNDKTVPLNVERITQAIRQAALMADERSRSVKFEFNDNRLSITSQSADIGDAKVVIPVDYNGSSVTIGFNAQYLLDFLNNLNAEEILFEFKDEQSPALMKPAKDDGYDYKYVVMPMRLL